MVWYDAVAIGQDAHAGTTPPSARRDALVLAARVVDPVDRIVRTEGEVGRGTVGELHVTPNSRDVIPGEARFSVEFRHPEAAALDRLDALFQREARQIAEGGGVTLALNRLFRIGAQPFDEACVALVRQAANRLGLPAPGGRVRCRARRDLRGAASACRHDLYAVSRRLVPQ